MEAAVKPEPVWLLEDQAMLDGMMREEEAITLPDIKEECLKTDMQGLRNSLFQIDAEIKNEASVYDDENEDIKTKIDFEEHRILEESLQCFPSYKRSDHTGAHQLGEININSHKPDGIVTKRMKSHTKDKRFKCDLCIKCFTQRTHLADHMRTHTGSKPFKCEVCSKCFTQRGTLTDHIRTHSGDKRFKCEVCSKNFTQRSTLTDHIRTHTGDKPFKCEVCGRSFKRRSHLSCHIKSHSGDKSFKCEVCSRCFTLRSTLTRHIRTHTRD